MYNCSHGIERISWSTCQMTTPLITGIMCPVFPGCASWGCSLGPWGRDNLISTTKTRSIWKSKTGLERVVVGGDSVTARDRLWKVTGEEGKLRAQFNLQFGSTNTVNADPLDYYQTSINLVSAYSPHMHSLSHMQRRRGSKGNKSDLVFGGEEMVLT